MSNWKVQTISYGSQMNPALRTHEFMGFVDGSKPCPSPFLPDSEGKETLVANPDHAFWHRKDQFLLSWINATLAEKVLSTVYGMTTSRQVWSHLAKNLLVPTLPFLVFLPLSIFGMLTWVVQPIQLLLAFFVPVVFLFLLQQIKRLCVCLVSMGNPNNSPMFLLLELLLHWG